MTAVSTPSPDVAGGTFDRLQLARLRPFPGNARRGDVPAIAASLRRRGQYKPLVISTDDVVLAGNHTLAAMLDLGWETADVWRLPIGSDDPRAAEIVLVDNRTADLGGYDPAALVALLESVPSYADAALGYDREDMAELLATVAPPPSIDPDAVPSVPDEPVSQDGDVWVMADGKAALTVGSATDRDAVLAALRAVGAELADVLWTDPPYGVDYVGKTKDALRITGDATTGLPALLADAFAAATTALVPGAPWYVAHADTERTTFEQAAKGAGWTVRQPLVWVKNTMVLGHADYQWQHEPILYGYTGGGGKRLGRGGRHWYGPNNATTVLHADKPAASKDHPTMKPTALITACLRNSARPGMTVLDPFAGSGSTLVAAVLFGARGAGVEIDPRYADVIARRMQSLTGHPSLLVRDGETQEVILRV